MNSAQNWTLIIHPDFSVTDELKQKLSKLLTESFNIDIRAVKMKPNEYEPVKSEDYFFVYLEVAVDDKVAERIFKVETYIEKSMTKLTNKPLDVGNRKWIVIYQKRVHFTVFYHFDSKKQDFYKQLIDSSKQELKQSIAETKKELMVLHDKQLKFLTKHLKKHLETKKVECKFSDIFVQPQPNYPVLYIFNKMDGELDQAREKLLKETRNLMDDRSRSERPKYFIITVGKPEENRVPNRGRDYQFNCPFTVNENADGILTSYSVDPEYVNVICEKLDQLISN